MALKRSPERAAFIAADFKAREFFEHIALLVPKAYPDTFIQLIRRGFAPEAIDNCVAWQLNLYATDPADIGPEAFSHHELNWHRQQLGLRGLVGAAGLVEIDGRVEVTLLQSDLVQQAHRHPDVINTRARTRLDSLYGHWWRPLLNACLDATHDLGYDELWVPSARQILSTMRNPVDGALFERVYDSPSRHYVTTRVEAGAAEYWQVPLATNRSKMVGLVPVQGGHRDLPRQLHPEFAPAPGDEQVPALLLFHDIEENVDTDVSVTECRAALSRMLAIESAAQVRLTYNVLGTLMEQHREAIAEGNHVLGFHSFDHSIGDTDQLRRCRAVDPRIRGFRPARSLSTAEHGSTELRRYDFEWLLSSAWRFGRSEPWLAGGVAHLPVHLDDYSLWTGELDLAAWTQRLDHLLSSQPFVAVGLHDCYSARWLDDYAAMLDRLLPRVRLVTAEEVAARLFVQAALEPRSVMGEPARPLPFPSASDTPPQSAQASGATSAHGSAPAAPWAGRRDAP